MFNSKNNAQVCLERLMDGEPVYIYGRGNGTDADANYYEWWTILHTVDWYAMVSPVKREDWYSYSEVPEFVVEEGLNPEDWGFFPDLADLLGDNLEDYSNFWVDLEGRLHCEGKALARLKSLRLQETA